MKSFYIAFIVTLIGSIAVSFIYYFNDKKVGGKWADVVHESQTRQIEIYENSFKIKLHFSVTILNLFLLMVMVTSLISEVLSRNFNLDVISFSVFSYARGNNTTSLMLLYFGLAVWLALVYYSQSGHECLKCKKNFFQMLSSEIPKHYKNPLRRVWDYLRYKNFACNHCGQKYKFRAKA